MSHKWREFKNLEGGGLDFNKVIRHLPLGTEENNENTHSGYPVRWPRFEPSISQVLV
jgi:hypothetical protein